MPKPFQSDDGTGLRSNLLLADAPAHEGAAGQIFEVEGRPDMLVKLYKSDRWSAENLGKIRAMLDNPPPAPFLDRRGVVQHKLAWPTHLIFDRQNAFRGFAMPRLDGLAPIDLESVFQSGSRKALGIRDDNRLRIAMSRDLAGLVGQLHAREHFVIDLKPQNLLCDGAGYVAMFDCDGFSINGPRRYPAREFSADYIEPEARTAQPNALGLSQDLFALAVIVFKLLNNGIHPHQGIPRTPQPTAIQDRIYGRLYAYGLRRSETVDATLASIHEYFDLETRTLFDRSFAGPASLRPSALEWHTHLVRLETHVLQTCKRNRAHSHFGLGCGLCALDDRLRGRSAKRPDSPPAVARMTEPNAVAPQPAPQPAYSAMPAAAATRAPVPRQRLTRFPIVMTATIVLACAIIFGRSLGARLTPIERLANGRVPVADGSSVPAGEMPSGDDAVATVRRYYDLWNAKRYREMYDMLSHSMRQRYGFDSYAASHAHVRHISVTPAVSSDPSVVTIHLTSEDLDGKGAVSTNSFAGSWHLVREHGSLKLEGETLHAVPAP